MLLHATIRLKKFPRFRKAAHDELMAHPAGGPGCSSGLAVFEGANPAQCTLHKSQRMSSQPF